MLILAHSTEHYRRMGKLVAGAKELDGRELFRQYEELLMTALRLKATPSKHENVLLHMLGYFKKQLSADEKQELLQNVQQYRAGAVPLIVPVTLIKHYVRKYGQPYLEQQYYLAPHPLELQMRSHA